ncbi:uncharacterized protein N7483_010806 [Penicillium malachiteum]|uniref:uncharacterized protein n=1 Tax=Penicillium malachiteum TaxID=1324776 RepID=UPI0025483E8E|nr:uncharacterized protein N7483_010806 [Penicillium malachiteum]KAJ5713625.1 hypothetical protein N7483_010806 [Penicillium malachiteum]
MANKVKILQSINNQVPWSSDLADNGFGPDAGAALSTMIPQNFDIHMVPRYSTLLWDALALTSRSGHISLTELSLPRAHV